MLSLRQFSSSFREVLSDFKNIFLTVYWIAIVVNGNWIPDMGVTLQTTLKQVVMRSNKLSCAGLRFMYMHFKVNEFI